MSKIALNLLEKVNYMRFCIRSLSLMQLKSFNKFMMRFKLKDLFNINVVDHISGEGKLKAYDVIEKIATRYFIPSKTIKDFFEYKYCIKRLIIQWIIIILIWIAPIKWFIELIVYQTYDYHETAYYTSYYGMVFGKDEVSAMILGILVVFCANYYHSLCKSIFFCSLLYFTFVFEFS